MTDSIETVLKLADGLLVVDVVGGEKISFSQSFSCPDCGINVDEIEPRSFSFNNPFGACPECHGIGYRMEFDEDLIIPDKTLSIARVYRLFSSGCVRRLRRYRHGNSN